MPTHYDVLGVWAGAEADELRRVYHVRARELHPDTHAGAPSWVLDEMQRAMSALNEAWRVLSDPELRRRYDDDLSVRAQRGLWAPAQRPKKRRRLDPVAALGPGFYHYGVSRYWVRSDGRRMGALVLGVDTTDLTPLRRLAANDVAALHADGVALHDASLEPLAHLTGLRSLSLAGTGLTDAAFAHLRRMRRLESLDVWSTAVTDAGVRELARVRTLRDLNLGDTRVTDAGVVHLAALDSLTTLVLRGTRVTSSGLHALEGLRGLRILGLPRGVSLRERRWLRATFPGIALT